MMISIDICKNNKNRTLKALFLKIFFCVPTYLYKKESMGNKPVNRSNKIWSNFRKPPAYLLFKILNLQNTQIVMKPYEK